MIPAHIQPLRVSFKTIDGILLKGCLYAAESYGPAVIMTPGWNCVKEMLLPEVAEAFRLSGVTALIYDPRNTGESEGLPRGEVDPMKQVEDYSDAFTFLAQQEMVNPAQIGFWGMSFAASVAASAAALDKRASFLLVVCPTTRFYEAEKLPKALEKAIQDRVSQLKGNKPFTVVPFTRNGDNPIGLAGGGGREAYEFMVNIKSRGAANFQNRTTMQSYYKMVMWQPQPLFKFVSPTPVLVLVPEEDKISPPADQYEMYAGFQGPKRLLTAPGKGHLNVLSGPEAAEHMQGQVKFIQDVLEGKLSG